MLASARGSAAERLPGCRAKTAVAAMLGFRWSYALCEQHARPLPLEPVGADAWDAHLPVLRSRFADWELMPGVQAL